MYPTDRTRGACCAIVLAAGLAAIACPALGQTVTGSATARDGDDLIVTTADGAQRVRLCGIDAADRHKAARVAKAELQALVAGREVRCVVVGGGTPCDGRSKARSGKRLVAQCFAAGLDVAAEMVRGGWACDWPRYSGGHYSRFAPADATVCE